MLGAMRNRNWALWEVNASAGAAAGAAMGAARARVRERGCASDLGVGKKRCTDWDSARVRECDSGGCVMFIIGEERGGWDRI